MRPAVLYLELTEEQLEAESARVAEEIRKRLESRCRENFAAFFRAGWSVVEGTSLLWAPHLQALCDTAQAFAEGWLVAHQLGTPAMVERQAGHWRAAIDRRIAAGDVSEEQRADYEALLATRPWEREALVDHLVVNGGPSTLKSRIWMVYLQSWVWLHAPGAAFACTSGTGKNVSRDSRHTKDLISSSWYADTFRPTWRVGVTSSGSIKDSVELWGNSAGGERISIPWLSSWSGVHVDFLFGDDPDDAKKVWSTSQREETRETYDLAMGNRLKLGSVTMMLQQHVHADDLTSNLKLRGLQLTGSVDIDNERIRRAKASGSWTVDARKRWAAMVLPIEFNPSRRCTTPWGWTDWRTTPGEVLFAEQWTSEVIAAEKERLKPAGWNAQGNQDPESSSTGELQHSWFRWCVIEGDAPPFRHRPTGCHQRGADGVEPAYVIKRKPNGKLDVDWLVVSVDPKNGSKRRASSNVGLVVMAGKGNMRFVLDDRSRLLGWLDTIDAIKELVARWGPDSILIEEKAQGEAATETLRKDIATAKLKGPDGRPIVAAIINVEGGSTAFEDRWNAALPSFRAGLVFLLDGAEWNEEYVDELTSVPNGKKDDRADATCQTINHFASHNDPAEKAKRETAALSALARMQHR